MGYRISKYTPLREELLSLVITHGCRVDHVEPLNVGTPAPFVLGAQGENI